MQKLVVIAVFKKEADGTLVAASPPQTVVSENAAFYCEDILARSYDGVIAWSREIDLNLGIYGDPKILYQAGDVPDLDDLKFLENA